MIIGSSLLVYSKDPEAEGALFSEVVEFCSIDVGEGWLIVATVPADAGTHRLTGEFSQQHVERPECSLHRNAAGAVGWRHDRSIAEAWPVRSLPAVAYDGF